MEQDRKDENSLSDKDVINTSVVASLSNNSSTKSLESVDSIAGDLSHNSSDDEKKILPVFTNEVIIIRPEMFYENKDCQEDNKFMKHTCL